MFAKKITKSASARDLRRILWHDIARVRYFLRLALLVLAGVMSAPAHANIACEIANISLTASAGTISVPVAAPVGQTLASLAPSTFQMSCHFVTRVNSVTEATNYANFATSQLAPGFTDVYQTNVAGIGIRYTFDSAQCNATHVVMTNGQAQVGCYFSGPLDGPYQNANITVTPTLVVTGTIAPGTKALSTAFSPRRNWRANCRQTFRVATAQTSAAATATPASSRAAAAAMRPQLIRLRSTTCWCG